VGKKKLKQIKFRKCCLLFATKKLTTWFLWCDTSIEALGNFQEPQNLYSLSIIIGIKQPGEIGMIHSTGGTDEKCILSSVFKNCVRKLQIALI